MPTSLLTCPAVPEKPRHPIGGGPSGCGDPTIDARLRQVQKLAAAGRLASGLVHDFNNVLLVVGACLDRIVTEAGDTSIVDQQARLALDALDRASALARQLASFGRLQGTSRQLTDLNDVVLAVARLVRPVAGAGIAVTVSCQTTALPAHVDAGQVEQALINLCLNARDAMTEGGTLRLATRCAVRVAPEAVPGIDPGARRYVVLDVSDTGAGIPLAAQPYVFEPFFTTKAAGLGSGLGLAIVRDILRAHGGFVEFASRPGHGTAFQLFFPHG